MYPHERSLVKRLQDKPFVLLGVNSDSDKAQLKAVLKKERITWRSWWDGGNPNGPIARRWNVEGWPTIYVLDAKGVIRYRDVRDEELDAAVDALVKETETGRTKLAAAKVEAARTAYEAVRKAFGEGRSDPEKVYLWSRRWLEARRDASPKKAGRTAAIEAHRQRMKDLRKMAEQRYKRGETTIADVLGADFYIAEAELWLSDAQKGD